MSTIFNLIKYAQEGEKRNLVTKPSSNSGSAMQPDPDPTVSGRGSIDYSYALQRAKQIIVEHGSDSRGAQVQLEKEILRNLDETSKNKLMKELDFFATREIIPALYKEDSGSNLSDIAKQLSVIIDNEGFDGARSWVDYNVPDELKESALNIIKAHEQGSFNISNLSEQNSDIVQLSLNILNKAAVKALKYLVEHQEVRAAMDNCGKSMLSDPKRRDRVARSIIDLASKGQSIFSREDLIGSMNLYKKDFLSFYVALHSNQLSKGLNPIITGPAHDAINKIFTTRSQTKPLGEVPQKYKNKHTDVVRSLFNNIDGGMNTHRLSDGKYMFEHLAEEIANGLNAEPPEPNALCIVMLKLENMAGSLSAKELSFSQVGVGNGAKGSDQSKGGIESIFDTGVSSLVSEDIKSGTTITSYSPGQASKALEMVKQKSEGIKSIISKVVAFSESIGQEDVVDYFQSAEARIDTALQSTENWLSGNIMAEKVNNAYSPNWHNMVEYIRKYQIAREAQTKENEDILVRRDFSKLPSTPMERQIDGINLKIYFNFTKTSVNRPSNQNVFFTDKDGRQTKINIPVYDPNIERVEIKDLMEPKKDAPSPDDIKTHSSLQPYISSSALIEGRSLSVDERINYILKILKDNISSFERATRILKQNMSGDTKTRIPRLLAISEDQLANFNLKALTAKGGILNKNSPASFEELLEARRVLPTYNYLNLLIAIAERTDRDGKPVKPMTPALNSSIRKILGRMADSGQISQEEYEEISKFRAIPQTALGGAKTANEVEAWIKVMAKMML